MQNYRFWSWCQTHSNISMYRGQSATNLCEHKTLPHKHLVEKESRDNVFTGINQSSKFFLKQFVTKKDTEEIAYEQQTYCDTDYGS